jgi:hypothetical protein
MTKFLEPSLQLHHCFEPSLEFGSHQVTAHPKDGLFLYGPHNKSKRTKEVRIGVVGTAEGINLFRAWATKIKNRVEVPAPGKGEKADRLHLADFPGLEEAFGITFNENELIALPIDPKEIDKATRILNLHEATAKVVRLYVDLVRRYHNNEERLIDVWVFVVPEIIYERCRPGAKRHGLPMEKGDFSKKQHARSDLPLLDELVDHKSEEIFDDVPDFHRQVKAACLTLTPTQIVRETTLDPEAFLNKAGYPIRRTQDRATVAWNMATGL